MNCEVCKKRKRDLYTRKDGRVVCYECLPPSSLKSLHELNKKRKDAEPVKDMFRPKLEEVEL